MLNAIMLGGSVIMSLLSCGIFRNDFVKKNVHGNADLNVFNGVSNVFSAITLAVIAAASGSLVVPSLFTVLIAILFGLATGLCAIFQMMALERGPLSYTNLICSCALVIPALSGLVLFGESVSVLQWVGMVLVLVSFACAMDKKDDSKGMNLKWLLLCIGSLIGSGSVGVMQKIHQNSEFKNELGVFLVIAFITSALLSAVLCAWYTKKKGERVTVTGSDTVKKLAIMSVVCGVFFALCNQINMYLAGVMDAIIFYPVINGASMILTSAAGIIIWRERLSAKQWVGMALGAIAIFLLCGVF